ncbi:DUF3634 family protein [Vibrio tritonius]|uniref:DUF3634 family protein n=1 Tax=Vibrio tritonius TaxID=1435069 RepID=A0ABS7YSL8_9VIBR|nr:DUF3634 family protein [Vibrio tritonius]MCA2018689.1 DUF3634 family protein [Vibrio tritonius]
MWYLIIVAVVVIVWLVLDRPVLRIQVKDGKLGPVKGHCPPSFKHHLKEIGEHSPFSGMIKVYQLRTGSKLVFSAQVPKKVQQRIRNVFPHQGFKTVNQNVKSR